MYKSWKDWLSLNTVELKLSVLMIGCVAVIGMLMRWSL